MMYTIFGLIGLCLGYAAGCYHTKRIVWKKATGKYAGAFDVPGDDGVAFVRCTLEERSA